MSIDLKLNKKFQLKEIIQKKASFT